MIFRREEFVEESEQDEKFPVKQIERLTSLDGKVTRFVGRVQLAMQTPLGMTTLPVTFEIEARTVEEAFRLFAQRAEEEVEAARRELASELQELRRRSASRIVTATHLPPEAAGGAGKIKLP